MHHVSIRIIENGNDVTNNVSTRSQVISISCIHAYILLEHVAQIHILDSPSTVPKLIVLPELCNHEIVTKFVTWHEKIGLMYT